MLTSQVWGQGLMEMMESHRWITRVTNDPESFGQTVRHLREARGWSQARLARALFGEDKGTRQNTVSAWERNAVLPEADVVARIARALDADLSELAVAYAQQAERNKAGEAGETGELPGPAIAVADQPGMYELMDEAIKHEDPDDAREALYLVRTNPRVREFIEAVMADVAGADAELAASQDEMTAMAERHERSRPCRGDRLAESETIP